MALRNCSRRPSTACRRKADIRFLPGKTHFDLYTEGDERQALLWKIAWEIFTSWRIRGGESRRRLAGLNRRQSRLPPRAESLCMLQAWPTLSAVLGGSKPCQRCSSTKIQRRPRTHCPYLRTIQSRRYIHGLRGILATLGRRTGGVLGRAGAVDRLADAAAAHLSTRPTRRSAAGSSVELPTSSIPPVDRHLDTRGDQLVIVSSSTGSGMTL